MRKFQHQQPLSFLPNIAVSTSRKDFKQLDENISKENLIPNKSRIAKLGIKPAHFCLAKISQTKEYLFQLNLTPQTRNLQNQKSDALTIPKLSKPWMSKQIDMNKETTKNSRLHQISNKERHVHLLKRKSYMSQKERGNSLKLIDKTDEKTKIEDTQSNKIIKSSTKRSIPVTREKIYSCRIALKHNVFPMHPKRQESPKIQDFFEQDQTLSSIIKKQSFDQEDVFISFDSYIEMDL